MQNQFEYIQRLVLNDKVPCPSPATVLEVECATGYFLSHLVSFVGIFCKFHDLSQHQALRKCRSKMTNKNIYGKRLHTMQDVWDAAQAASGSKY